MARDHTRVNLDIWGEGGETIAIDAHNVHTWNRSGWHVYVAYDELRRCKYPLYVGVTGELYERLSHHRRRSPWFPLAGSILIHRFDSRVSAYEAEDRLIYTLQPMLNIVERKRQAV